MTQGMLIDEWTVFFFPPFFLHSVGIFLKLKLMFLNTNNAILNATSGMTLKLLAHKILDL
jgi:hypothetical protein